MTKEKQKMSKSNSEKGSQAGNGIRAAVYPASRMYYDKVLPSVKSLLRNSDVERIYLTIEDDDYPEELPECVKVINARRTFEGHFRGPNVMRTPYVYLCMARVMYADVFRDVDRILALDADTLVMRPIGDEPWSLDMKGCHVAGVPELKISAERRRPYVNAGVLIMDLAQIRSDGFGPQMLEAINSRAYQWLEQDCINEQCRILPLGSEWNACQFTMPVEPEKVKIRHWAYEMGGWKTSLEVEKYRRMSWDECQSKV